MTSTSPCSARRCSTPTTTAPRQRSSGRPRPTCSSSPAPRTKATYSGLLKAFLDRVPTDALAGARAVPVLLGGAPNHQLAVDLHLTPLLLELGAAVPVRGLFVLESELDALDATAAAWAARVAPTLACPATAA